MGFVRVTDEFGNQISVDESDPWGLIKDGTYTVLDGYPAVDGHGYALPAVPAARDQQTGEVLRGKALTEALAAAGLSTSGTVAEKQVRLAEYQASLEATNPNTSEE